MREDLERLQKLNHTVMVVRGKRLKRPALAKSFTDMRKNRFPHGCEVAVVRVEPGIANSPELVGEELRAPREKTSRTCGLVLIGGFHSTRELLVLWLNAWRRVCSAQHITPFAPESAQCLKKHNQNLKIVVLQVNGHHSSVRHGGCRLL